MTMAAKTWTAVMADGAVAKDGMTVAVMTDDGTFTIHGGTAGTAVVHKTAAGAVSIKRL